MNRYRIVAASVVTCAILAIAYRSVMRDEEESKKEPTVEEALAMTTSGKPGDYMKGICRLAEHWRDPRAEARLVALSKDKPHVVRDGLLTSYGEAARCLGELRARRRHAAILEDARTPAGKLAAIRGELSKEPPWQNEGRRSLEDFFLLTMLLRTAVEADGASCADLVFRFPVLPRRELEKYIRKHPEAATTHARKMGCSKTVAYRWYLEELGRSGSAQAVALLEEWFRESADGEDLEAIVIPLAYAAGGKRRLIKMLRDDRAVVPKRAALWLQSHHPDKESLAALRAARKSVSGKSAELAAEFDMAIKRIEAEMAEPRSAN